MSDLFSEKHYWEIIKKRFFYSLVQRKLYFNYVFKCAVDHRHQSFIFFSVDFNYFKEMGIFCCGCFMFYVLILVCYLYCKFVFFLERGWLDVKLLPVMYHLIICVSFVMMCCAFHLIYGFFQIPYF